MHQTTYKSVRIESIKKGVLAIIIFFSLFGYAQNNTVKVIESEQNCTFVPLKVYIDDADQNKTNIRKIPNGKIILSLNQQDDYFTLTITKAINGWFKVINIIGIEANNIEIPEGVGWIHSSVIGVATRKKLELLYVPKNGRKTGTIGQEVGVKIKDICSNWIQIEYKGSIGWVESKWLCGNPVTTCP